MNKKNWPKEKKYFFITSVSSPWSICSRIIWVYVRDAKSGVFPPENNKKSKQNNVY